MNVAKQIRTVLFTACFAAAGVFGLSQNAYAARIGSENQASAKALEKVKGATVTDVERDHEQGVVVYEVELVKGNKKFDITYRASDAKILSYGWDKIAVMPNSSKAIISEEQCRSLAQNKVKKGTILSIARKHDDGIDYYKVKMTDAKKIYKLEYHARTGALIEYEWKRSASSGSGNNANNGYIGLSKAKQIAKGKVPGATVVKAEFDMDDGIPVYEIELVKGQYEYEYKIHAKTGKTLEWDKDFND